MLYSVLEHTPYVSLWIRRVSDVQFAEGEEGHLPRQVHLVKLGQDFGADLVRLHDVVKQPGGRKQSTLILPENNTLQLFNSNGYI